MEQISVLCNGSATAHSRLVLSRTIFLTTLELDSNKQCFFPAFAAIPSLRARDCSKNEKEALNYLFLLIPLLNVAIPFFLKSFAVVWSADTIAFFGMYAWKVCFVYP